MKAKLLILIVVVFSISCKTHRNLVNQQTISGEYISKSTNKFRDGNFKIVNENVHHFIFNDDNTYEYSNKIISKSDIVSVDELSWSNGNWINKNNYLTLNSIEYFPNITIDETSKINELNIKLIVDDFLNEIDSSNFSISICKKNGDCTKTKSNSPVKFDEKSLFIKIIPDYNILKQHWIINNKELKTDYIDFPVDERGLTININIGHKDFTFLNFESGKIKVSNEFLIFNKKKFSKIDREKQDNE